MKNTVTTAPAYGTVEYYVDRLRETPPGLGAVQIVQGRALGIVESIVRDDWVTDADKVRYLTNLLDAERIILDEHRAAARR